MKANILRIEISLQETLDDYWTIWFEGLTLTSTNNGETLLCGEIQDRSALHGYLERIRDLNLKLNSVIVEEI